MQASRLVIVGSGLAGAKLVEEICGPGETPFPITIIGAEPGGSYDRIRLADRLDGSEPPDFWLNDEAWYAARGVVTRFGDAVVAIDRGAARVRTRSGASIPYDILVLATGARALVPPIKGAATPGVFVLRDLEDASALRAWMATRERVTVVGGGLLGLELADKLTGLGKQVTVSHLMDTLMEQQLDRAAALVLERRFAACGVRIEKQNPVVAIAPAEAGLALTRRDGTTLETDTVIINCGIVPDAALAEAAGLDTDRGVLVDNTLRTSDPKIYAIGECIAFQGTRYGLVAPVYAQARVLARRLGGEDAVYESGPLPMVRLKSDIPAVAMGARDPAEGDTVVVYDDPYSHVHKKLIIRDDKLVGAHLVGDARNADALAGYFASGLPLPRRVESLLFPGVKPAGQEAQAVYWPLNVTVCDCNGISAAAVRAAVRRFGRDMTAITRHTRAAVSCGACLGRVQAIADNSFDAVVVGAGLGGLTAAATLARSGRRVLVLERHDRVGGYATSFSREGYTFDVSLHNMGPLNGSVQRIFERLGLDERITFIPFDYFTKVRFPEHTLVVPKGFHRFIDQLEQIATDPAERAGLRALAEEIWTIRQGFDEIEMLTIDDPGSSRVSPLMAAKYPQFADYIFTTFRELMDKHVTDETLRGLLCNAWWYLGLPPSEMAAILYAVVGTGYIEHGGGVIEGTSQNLSDALRDIVLEHGGEVRLSTQVSRILTDAGRAAGVLTDSGEMFYSDTVLSNAGAINTFSRLVSDPTLKKRYLKKTRGQENSLSAVQLYLGLDCGLDAVGGGDEGHGFTVFESYDHEANYRAAVEGDTARVPFSCMLYSNQDGSLAPEGGSVLSLLCLDHIKNWDGLSRSAYQRRKREVIDTLLTRAERYLPGLRSHIVVQELGTPRTMHRYTDNPDGAIFGPSQNVYQSGLNRLQPETPVQGLYLVGSSIYPGGGYPSVINSGYRTAHLILSKE